MISTITLLDYKKHQTSFEFYNCRVSNQLSHKSFSSIIDKNRLTIVEFAQVETQEELNLKLIIFFQNQPVFHPKQRFPTSLSW